MGVLMPSIKAEMTYNVDFIGMDIEGTINEQLHLNSPQITDVLLIRIYDRTPEDTGALKSSLTGVANVDHPDDPLLSYLYANDQEQLDEWGRIYVAYQEGGALGLPTYTNPPREMFAKVMTEDLNDIAGWAVMSCQEALSRCSAGTGLKNA